MVRRGAGWVLEGPTETLPPAGFRHAVQQRTARLSADDRYVLAAAAVLGHHFATGPFFPPSPGAPSMPSSI
jgi:hypothetical protein